MQKSKEPQLLVEHSATKRFFQRMAELEAWEAANPELARDWKEANRLEHLRAQDAERLAQAKRLESDAPHQLGRIGVPQRAVLALRAVDVGRPGIRGVLAQVDEPRALLALLGGVGAGKTVAAAFLVRKRLADAAAVQRPSGSNLRESCMWVASSELASLSTFTDADRTWFERMQDCQLLVLDDFGTEDLHTHAVQRLERLIDVRYGNERETVLTSNCNVQGFAARAGERIADRFREAGRIVVCGDVSLRRQA
jgi:hypothetical protein